MTADILPDFITAIRRTGDWTVAELKGRLDYACSGEFWRSLARFVGHADRLQLDFGGVQYMDSAGLATLVDWLKRLSARGGRLRLSRLPDQIRALLKLARLDEAFDITDGPDRNRPCAL